MIPWWSPLEVILIWNRISTSWIQIVQLKITCNTWSGQVGVWFCLIKKWFARLEVRRNNFIPCILTHLTWNDDKQVWVKNAQADKHEKVELTLGVHLSIFLFLHNEHISSSITMRILNDKVHVWFLHFNQCLVTRWLYVYVKFHVKIA